MILYYTHKKRSDHPIYDYCIKKIWTQHIITNQNIVAVVPDGFNIKGDNEFGVIKYNSLPNSGIKDIYLRILKGLEYALPNEIVYLAEHDVLYHDSHFRQVPKSGIGYNLAYTYLSEYGYFQRHSNCLALGMMCGYPHLIKKGCLEILEKIEDNAFTCYEPTKGNFSNFKTDIPNVDIRWSDNASWHVNKDNDKFWNEIPNCNYWGKADELWKEVNGEKI